MKKRQKTSFGDEISYTMPKIDLHVSKVVGTHSFHYSLRLTSGACRKMLRGGFLCRHFKSGCVVGLPVVLGAWVFVRKLVERPFLSSVSLLSLSFVCLFGLSLVLVSCLPLGLSLDWSLDLPCLLFSNVLRGCIVLCCVVFPAYKSCLLACLCSCLLSAFSLAS
jgi:hypothetical protein